MKKIRVALPLLLTAVFEIIFGALLFKDPETFTKTVLMLFGIMLLAVGIMSLIRYIKLNREGGSPILNGLTLAAAVVSLVLGAICSFAPGAVIAIFTVLAVVYGIIFLIMGALKCQSFFAGRALEIRTPVLIIFGAVLTAVCGIVIITDPFKTADVMLKFLGIALIAQAVIDIVALIQIFTVVRVIENAADTEAAVTEAAGLPEADAAAGPGAGQAEQNADAAGIFHETPQMTDAESKTAE